MDERVKVPSLINMCVLAIVNHVSSLVTKRPNCTELKLDWSFLHPDCQLPPKIAFLILRELGECYILKSEHLTLFSRQYVNLHSLVLLDAEVNPISILAFRDFTLYNITAVNQRNH
nr:hypothetical transcript [Hymenolepis microstoma]